MSTTSSRRLMYVQFTSCVYWQSSAQLQKIAAVLPSSTNPITNQYLWNIEFMKDDGKRIIFKQDPNEAYSHGMISICMFKMSGDAIIKPLFTIFKKETLYLYLKKSTKKRQKLAFSFS